MKALRLVLFGIALVVLVSLGWRFRYPNMLVPLVQMASAPTKAVVPPPAPRPPDAATSRVLVLSRLADAVEYTPFFDRLREAFPSDYTSLVDSASAAVLQGSHVPNPDRLLIDGLRHLRQTRGILAAQAEAGPLVSVFEAQSALLDALAPEDPTLCVDFLYGGISPAFMAFAAKHRDAVERLAIANLSAIVSGKRSRVERTEPTSDDFDGITATLTKIGVSENEIAAVLDGRTFEPPLPENRLCDAGRLYLRTLRDLPEDVRLRIYALSAALVARS